MTKISKIVSTIFVSGIIISSFFAPLGVEAQTRKTLNDAQSSLEVVIPATGITEGNLDNQAATVVKGILVSMALVFFGLMVYSGIVWMTARGEEDRITKARETIIAATIGLIIVISAYAVTNLVVDKVLIG